MKGDFFGFHFQLDRDGFRCGWDKNNRSVEIPFVLIILAFIVFWPAGLVLLILQLSGEEKGAGKKSVPRQNRQDRTDTASRPSGREQADSQAGETPDAAAGGGQRRTSQTASSARAKRRQGKIRGGKAWLIVGMVLMAVFGIATVTTAIGDWYLLGIYPLWLAEEVLPLFLLTGLGAGLFTRGLFQRGRANRFRRFLSLAGDQDLVSVQALADAFPTSYASAVRTLQDMIDKGIFGPGAWLDRGSGLLVLDGDGVHPTGERQKAPQTPEEEENDWLIQIRAVNEAIAHPELSRKIDRIGEITQNILAYQKEHPEKAPELRKFLRYYLPTTLKILNAYAELEKQGVEGEHISATKQRIEGMMDMVVEGFEKQLDQLFAGDMMDIAADITVMEQMMRGDGLFQDGSRQTFPNMKEHGR